MIYQFKPEFVTALRSITLKNYPINHRIIWHQHMPKVCWEMIYVCRGQITLEIKDGPLFYLNAGNCCFIPGLTYHRISNSCNIPADYLDIMFYGNLPEELCLHPRLVGRRGHHLALKLRQESKKRGKYTELNCCCMLTCFIISLLSEEESFSFSHPAFLENFRNERAEKIFDILSREYRTISFEELADRMNVCHSVLYQIFRNEFGCTFSQFVDNLRFEQASYLLTDCSYSLSEIVSEIGCNRSSFFRLFKKKTGMTPSQFAKTLR